jgi:AcrR family transcriptional regulator
VSTVAIPLAGRPSAAKSVQTRSRIIDAARTVFAEVGYDAATYQAIADRAGLTRPAINHYFASKQNLYRQVVEQTNARIVSAAIAQAQCETTLLRRLSAFLNAARRADREDPTAAAFLVLSMMESQRHPALHDEIHESWADVRGFVTWLVDDAIDGGELITEADPGTIVEMLVTIIYGLAFYAGFVGSQDQVDATGAVLESLLSNKLWRLKG